MENYWTSSLQNGVPAGSFFGIPVMACQSCNQAFMDNEAFEAHVESHMVQAVLMTSSRRQYPSSPMSTPTMAALLQENMISPKNGTAFEAALLLQPAMPSPPPRMRRNVSAAPLPLQHTPLSTSLIEDLINVQSPPPIIPGFFRRIVAASRISDDGTKQYMNLLEKPIMKIQASEAPESIDLTLKLNSLEQ